MSEDLPPLDELSRSLLARNKSVTPIDDAAKARIHARVSSSIAALGAGGGGGAGGATAPAAPSTTARPASSFPRVPLWTVGAAFVVGGAVGLLGGAFGVNQPKNAASAQYVQNARDDRALSATATITTPGMTDKGQPIPVATPESLPLVPPSADPSAAPTAPIRPATDLSAERALLDDARAALAKGDPDHALASARTHEKRFPRGALAEEREAIAVQALAQAGKNDQARARAARFAHDYPDSMLLPAVKAAAEGAR